MSIKRTRATFGDRTPVDGAATKVAEGIGEALGRIVNRLESLDADRDRAYEQLLALQERLNEQVLRFGRAVGRTMTTAPAGRPEADRRPGRRRRQRPVPPEGSAQSEITQRSRPVNKGTPSRIRCGVCSTPGHNARGHARWDASRRK